MKLKGKRAIVTGASRGLGAKIAEVLVREGCKVMSVNRDGIAEVMAFHVKADLANFQSPEFVMQYARETWDSVDILINNAAITGPVGPMAECDIDDWKRCLKVNLFAPVELCKLVSAWMEETKTAGSIINISGGGATSPRPNYSAYATAKCGLVRFSETLAAEVERYGIRVNCVAPGLLNTRMGSPDGDPPDRAAELVAWLASDDSRPITGRLISAKWDHWEDGEALKRRLVESPELLTLRRLV